MFVLFMDMFIDSHFEIIISIVHIEDGNVIFRHKVLYRYSQILEIPIY